MKPSHETSKEDMAFPSFPEIDASMFVGTQHAMLEASRALGDIWSRSARHLMKDTTELTTRVVESKTPADFSAAYGKYLEVCLERFAVDSQEAMGIWQDAIRTMLSNGRADENKAGKRHR